MVQRAIPPGQLAFHGSPRRVLSNWRGSRCRVGSAGRSAGLGLVGCCGRCGPGRRCRTAHRVNAPLLWVRPRLVRRVRLTAAALVVSQRWLAAASRGASSGYEPIIAACEALGMAPPAQRAEAGKQVTVSRVGVDGEVVSGEAPCDARLAVDGLDGGAVASGRERVERLARTARRTNRAESRRATAPRTPQRRRRSGGVDGVGVGVSGAGVGRRVGAVVSVVLWGAVGSEQAGADLGADVSAVVSSTAVMSPVSGSAQMWALASCAASGTCGGGPRGPPSI